jgi:hypothetical protein
MKVKKILALVVSMAVISAFGMTMVSAAGSDLVSWNGNLAAGYAGTHVGGIYPEDGGGGSWSLSGGAFVFDGTKAYANFDLTDNDGHALVANGTADAATTPSPIYKYMLITVKASDASAKNIKLRLGQTDSDNSKSPGVFWKTFSDLGITFDTLNTDKTYKVDLSKFTDFKAWGEYNYAADFGLDGATNGAAGAGGTITISKLEFTNTDPDAAAPTTGTAAPVTPPPTGDTFPIAAIVLLTLVSGTVIFISARKLSRN